jgi:CBS domain-containing protein
MKVAEVMSSPAHVCGPSEPLARAAQIMWDQDTGVVPVVDREGRAIAMITDRDICMAALTQGKPLSELRVRSAMSKLLYTCHPEDELSAAERTMRVHQVRRLPVVDDAGRIVGLLSVNDICRERARLAVVPDVVTTLAAIGRPREGAGKRVAPREPAAEAQQIRRPRYRETDTLLGPPRMPPQPIRDPVALFRF